jgi:hypothetical protein
MMMAISEPSRDTSLGKLFSKVSREKSRTRDFCPLNLRTAAAVFELMECTADRSASAAPWKHSGKHIVAQNIAVQKRGGRMHAGEYKQRRRKQVVEILDRVTQLWGRAAPQWQPDHPKVTISTKDH